MRAPERLIQLKPHEQLVVVIREYLITQLFPLAIAGAVYFATVFFTYYLFSLGPLGGLAWLGLVLASVGYSLRKLWLWRQEVCIVTNQRCIDIQRPGLMSKAVRELPWNLVDDVRFSQRGLWATLWHYGSVTMVLTSGEEIEWQHIYQPSQVRDILAQYVEKLN